MKAYKLTRRKDASPIITVNVRDARFEKPKIPCTFIKKVHGIQEFTDRLVLPEPAPLAPDLRQVQASVRREQEPQERVPVSPHSPPRSAE